ncbi:carotenoid oxygenase [Cladochytrium replicatum]|nr:carotenoid oxygenase [Cladochytrium replicatum]
MTSIFSQFFRPAKRQIAKSKYPADPSYLGGLEATSTSSTDHPVALPVSGKIPAWLNGTLLQISPGQISELSLSGLATTSATSHYFDGVPQAYAVEFRDGRVHLLHRSLSRSAQISEKDESQPSQSPEVDTNAFVTVDIDDPQLRERLAKPAGFISNPAQQYISRLVNFLDVMKIRTGEDDTALVALGYGMEVLILETETLLTKKVVSLFEQPNLPFRTANSQYITIPKIQVDPKTREIFVMVVEFSQTGGSTHIVAITFEDLLNVNSATAFSAPSAPASNGQDVPLRTTSPTYIAWRLVGTFATTRPHPFLTFTVSEHFIVVLDPPCSCMPPPIPPAPAATANAPAPGAPAVDLSMSSYLDSLQWIISEPTNIHVFSRTTGWPIKSFNAAGFFPRAVANLWEVKKKNTETQSSPLYEPPFDIYLDVEAFDDSRIVTDALSHASLKNPAYNVLGQSLLKSTIRRYTLTDVQPAKKVTTADQSNAASTTGSVSSIAATTYEYLSAAANALYSEEAITPQTMLHEYPTDSFYEHMTNFPMWDVQCNPHESGLPNGVAYYFGLSHSGVPTRPVSKTTNQVVAGWFDQLVKVDLQMITQTEWQAPGCFPGSPVFVPDPSVPERTHAVLEKRKPDRVSEHKGVVISVVYDSQKKQSFILLLDAVNWNELARCVLPEVAPFPFVSKFAAN